MPHDNAALVALLREAADRLSMFDGTNVEFRTRLRAAADALAAGGEDEYAITLISSEISDAIAAHDAGETVSCSTRARHVVEAINAARRAEEPRHD